MSSKKLSENTFLVGVMNPSLRVFDIIMSSPFGTSYNAYLIKGEKIALIETAHEDYFDEYISNIEEITPISSIDYVILNHTEPDHSGSLKKLLELNPNIKVIASVAAAKYLTNMVNAPMNITPVRHGDTLDLGQSHVLKFIPAPFLHWPDSMFTFDTSTKVVYTCDFFGAHYCEPQGFDVHLKDVEAYDAAFKYYFEAIFGPFKEYVRLGLDKLNELDFKVIAPSHGVVLTESCQKYIDLYKSWSSKKELSGKKAVLIVYASAYGYTKQLAEAAETALTTNGYTTFIYDIVKTPLPKIIETLESCDAFIIATNTINRDATKPLWDLLSSLDAINTKKPAGVMGSYGWSGEAVDMVMTRLAQIKFVTVGEGIKVLFRPIDDDLQAAAAYALEIASKIK